MPAWLGTIAALAAQTADPAACEARLCRAEALAPYFAALERSGSVRILQIGDSHSAGDMISGPWRQRLQARYGHGGRGLLAAGRPYAGYLTWGVTARQSSGWRVNASFGRDYAPDGPPLGLTGFTQTAQGRGEVLSLTADTADQAFDRLVVCAIAGPETALLHIRVGAAEHVWPVADPARAVVCGAFDSYDGPALTASVTTEDDGRVSITSLALLRGQGGIVLSNLGVIGSQLAHFGRTDDIVMAEELAGYRPDLIVLAFGTNEGFSPDLSPVAYERTLREQVARIRRLAGEGVPILLLGAPDAATRQPAIAGQACWGGWSTPRRLGLVRERQRTVARDLGLAFWDWSAAMGGRCASLRWVRTGLMRQDHVHFTREGGERIGAMIDADLSRAAGAPH